MRDPYLDNTKFFLIVFVVFGHLLEPILDKSSLAHSLYIWIYLFHMPAFIFLAGITTRPESWGRRDRKLLWMLIVFQIPYTIEGIIFKSGVAFPFWILWFLLSLLYWRALAALVCERIPKSLVFGGTVVVSAFAGYFPASYLLSIKRTLVFAPFFFLGLFWGKQILDLVRRRSLTAQLTAATAIAAAYIFARKTAVDFPWLYGTVAFNKTQTLFSYPWVFRSLLLALSTALVIAVLALVPVKENWITNLGKTTLVVYLAHGLVVIPLRSWIAQMPPAAAWTTIFVATAVLVAVFSSDLSGRVFAMLIRDVRPQNAPAPISNP